MSIELDQASPNVINNLGFQLKGGLFTLTTLQIFNDDLEQLKQQLLQKIQQAPNFFLHAPLVLDIRIKTGEAVLDFVALRGILNELRLIPVGVKSANVAQVHAAQQCGFAVLRDNLEPKAVAATATATDNSEREVVTQKEVRNSSAKVITQPVRSGQQIYAPDGDLIIVNHVSPGAELIAEGSIHVYGALRGRALAGINGDTQTRIFCKSLEAELVSIAGNYKLSEDIERQAWKIAAQIYVKGDRLQISAL